MSIEFHLKRFSIYFRGNADDVTASLVEFMELYRDAKVSSLSLSSWTLCMFLSSFLNEPFLAEADALISLERHIRLIWPFPPLFLQY